MQMMTNEMTLAAAIAKAADQRAFNSIAAARFLSRIAPNIKESEGHWIWCGRFFHRAPVVSKNSGLQVKRETFGLFVGEIGDVSLQTTCGIRACVSPSHLRRSPYPKGGSKRLRTYENQITPTAITSLDGSAASLAAESTAALFRAAATLRAMEIDPAQLLKTQTGCYRRTNEPHRFSEE